MNEKIQDKPVIRFHITNVLDCGAVPHGSTKLPINSYACMVRDLIKLANKYFLAVYAQDMKTIAPLIEQMKILANNGIRTVDHFLEFSRNRKSYSLALIKNSLSQIFNELNNANVSSGLKIKKILGEVAFYTTPSNAGTGYDPVTRIADPSVGYAAPAFYTDKLMELNVEFIKALSTIKTPKGTTIDPLNQSVSSVNPVDLDK